MTEEEMERCFPKLKHRGFQVTSPFDDEYKCISFAAEDSRQRWWWPSSSSSEAYWPPGVPRRATLTAFAQAFQLLGYGQCPDGAFQAGFQKIAIYTDQEGIPTHASRQLSDGTWASKLGKCEDIRHADAAAVEDTPTSRTAYGQVAIYMKRPIRP